MQSRIFAGFFICSALAVCLPAVAQADTREILDEIAQTADKICGAVSQAGSSTSVEAKGDVKALLSGLLKHLADLGVEGGGSVDVKNYEGVVQDQLAGALENLRNCKEKVFDILQKKLIPDQQGALPSGVQDQLSDIKQLLENINSRLTDARAHGDQEFTQLAHDRDLDSKYPLGFAIFYSDGHKILSYGKPGNGRISFDPSTLTISARGKFECLSVLPVSIDGRLMNNFTNLCFSGNGGVMHAARVGDTAIDIEPLGGTSEGLAWIIGMKQA
jgi:hypothetical protein